MNQSISALAVKHTLGLYWTLIVSLVAPMCAVIGFVKLFTTWAPYDDEGYVLVTLQHHASGLRLYDDIFTQYGPGFYGIEAMLRAIVPHALTSDNQRWKTLVVWLFTVVACGWAATRLAGQAVLGAACALFLFVHLDRLALEPGHPQMWCALLTGVLVLWLTFSPSNRAQRAVFYWMIAGAICGTIAMIKPNIGGLAVVGLVAGILWHNRTMEFTATQVVERVFTTLLMFAPWALFSSVLSNPVSWLVPAVTCISLWWIREECIKNKVGITNRDRDTVFNVLSVVLGTVFLIAFFLGWSIWQGVTLAGLQRGLMSQHGDLIKQFYHQAPLPIGTWVPTLILIYAALESRMSWLPKISWGTIREWEILLLPLFVLVCVTAIIIGAGSPLVHGLIPRGAAGLLASLGCLLAWKVVSVWSGREGGCPSNLVGLVCVVVLAPLAAFPTPGTQIAVGTLGLLVVFLATFQGDRQPHESRDFKMATSAADRRFPRRSLLLPVASLLLFLLAVIPSGSRWLSRESLALPGAAWLRLSAEETEEYRGVVNRIKESHADSIAFVWHNRNSFYGWSGLRPLSAMSPTFWPYLLSSEQQSRVMQDMQQFDKIAIIDEEYSTAMMPPRSALQEIFLKEMHGPRTESPFAVYVHAKSSSED
jgi:hypothetical protein